MPETEVLKILGDVNFKISLAQDLLKKGQCLMSWEMLEESRSIIKDAKQTIENNIIGVL